MSNLARRDDAPGTIHARFASSWARDVVRPDRDPVDRSTTWSRVDDPVRRS